MEWTVLVPWINETNAAEVSVQWIVPYVNSWGKHLLNVQPLRRPLPSWQSAGFRVSPPSFWLIYWREAGRALENPNRGFVTAYPQFPATVSVRQAIMHPFRRRRPVVACLFSIGNLLPGVRKWLARLSLRGVDRFVVVCERERTLYSRYLDLPVEKFEVVRCVMPDIREEIEEEREHPFIISSGSSHRDYACLLSAVKELGVPTIISASRKATANLDLPSNVEAPQSMPRNTMLRLTHQARMTVVPLRSRPDIASGMLTIVEGMMMGRPVIASRCAGAEDYIVHGQTGLLVEPDSPESLREAISALWNDEALRLRLGKAARQYALDNFSDEAGARAIAAILDKVAATAAG
ncbi:MAG: glycosyltransferase family 4 protein [Panacagrimonas sp.]